MTSQVTQCPNCNTSFRVTEVQLSVANGMVRCGSCLHIFNAADHWLINPAMDQDQGQPHGEEPTELPVSPEEPGDDELINDTFDNTLEQPSLAEDSLSLDSVLDDEPEPDHRPALEPEPNAELASDLDADLDASLDNIFDGDLFADDDLDLLADEVLESHEQAEQALDPSQPENLAEEPLPEQEAAPFAMSSEFEELDSDEILLDESELESDATTHTIINTDNDLDELIQDDEEISDSDFSDSFLELDQEEESALAVFKELDDIGEDNGLEEEDWARKLLEEEVEEHQPVAEAAAEPETEEPIEEPRDEFTDLFESLEDDETPLDPGLLDILNERNDDSAPQPIQEDEFVISDEAIVAGDRIGFDKSDLLANIEPEPVELDIASRRNLWIKRTWLASIVLATLLLAVQHIAFNYDRLARDNSYRPVFSSLCSVFGCEVPALHDISQIRSSNLMVRSHPELKHALVVDAIIINRAEFKQQFPVMELQFTDINGSVVAGRRFKPSEYLAGELAGTRIMPTKQPIHISLEIVDPGEQAVNYQLRFYPKQGS
ncbi:DUF3426 domain-containing protein [Oceanicoccus sagamiensis]|uniref:Zinc finger/thioredoxin putative domain-containing protein n=1 Tax=Oceanicoccus sagamiensis TaxID=716816 RepID=A0A1X9NF27_9GAMM|nr:DUF3426 domain-containing protein [Oceanicoccus sagamiensis]ARN73547.1 hypothetical protein BST96_05075 [Oceanicoccus sagamiensis]